ncbi:hypothetical protein J6590_012334 [Homalodisca vitripennis]|nr:hypothetical protein J6590_012334 [Homalodisca vitripennis]
MSGPPFPDLRGSAAFRVLLSASRVKAFYVWTSSVIRLDDTFTGHWRSRFCGQSAGAARRELTVPGSNLAQSDSHERSQTFCYICSSAGRLLGNQKSCSDHRYVIGKRCDR